MFLPGCIDITHCNSWEIQLIGGSNVYIDIDWVVIVVFHLPIHLKKRHDWNIYKQHIYNQYTLKKDTLEVIHSSVAVCEHSNISIGYIQFVCELTLDTHSLPAALNSRSAASVIYPYAISQVSVLIS